MKRTKNLSHSIAVSAVMLSGTAMAGGYQISERSASDLGRAFSGGGATVDDASIIATNPAGMSFLSSPQVSLSLNLVNGNVETELTKAGIEAPNLPFIKTEGKLKSGNVAPSNSVIPAVYATYPINEQIVVGLGAFSNFSTSTHYKDSFAGSILALDSEIVSFNINPSVSYKLDDQFSFGFGLNAVNVAAKISSSNPAFGPLTDSNGSPVINNGQPVIVPTRGKAGSSEVSGSAWGYGWNFGLMYSINEDARVSLTYRSHVATTLEGDTKFKDSPDNPLYKDYETKAPIKLPAIASLSGAYNFLQGWTASADVTFTQWSSFEKLETFASEDDSLKSQTIEKWRDSYRAALGLTYAYNETMSVRTGVALDDSPIPNDRRTLRIPTSNMTWLSLGGRYSFNPQLIVDLGYSYVFMDETELQDERTFVGQPIVATAEGKTKLGLHIVGLQLSYNI